MQFIGRALLASVFVLGACAGGEKSATKTDSTSVTSTATTTTPAATDSTAMAAPAAAPAGAPAAGAVAPAPATGKTVEVKMLGDEKGYRFDPAEITIKSGDAIKFTNVSGGPHSVGFDPAKIPPALQPQLGANMPGDHSMGALEGPMLLQPNESYTISFAKIPAGEYDFHCTPHLALGMKGEIKIQ